MTAQCVSRGLRNSNPGNIRLSPTRFKGETEKSNDSAFKQFRDMAWGYRAMFVVLNTYRTKWGLTTISQMIGRWAPPTENDTDKYIQAVSHLSNLDPDTPIDTHQSVVMMPLVAAMSQVENGQKADWALIERGWELYIVDQVEL